MADTRTKVDQPPAPAAASGQTLFARQSSGLVREISLGSAIAINVSFISIVYGIIGVTLVPLAFPGASLAGSVIVCTVLCLPPYLMYSYFSRAMPRSGGDFVFVSRGLHPWVGLAASINGTLWYMVAITYAGFSTVQSALSGTLASVGTLSGNHTLVNWSTDVLKHGWTLGLALVVIFLIYACVCVRLHTTLAITRWMFYFVIAGTVLAAAVLLFSSRGDFISGVHKAGGSYTGIIAASYKAGYTGHSHFSLGKTILASSVPFYALGFGIATAYVGGEVRGGKDVATRGKFYSLLLGGAAMTIIYALAGSRIGYDFLGGSTLLSTTASPAYTLGAPANLFFFVGLMSHSTVIAVLLGLAFLASAIAVAIPAYLISSRALFAWSFDRFLPDSLSEVNERTRAPLRANTIATVVAVIMLIVVVFSSTSFAIALSSTEILGLILTFIVVSVAAIAFPYRRRSIYQGSPIERSIGGIPVITLVGVVSLGVYVLFAIAIAGTSGLATVDGRTTNTGLYALILFVAIGIVAYPLIYLFNKRRGLDISLASRELPPE